MRPATTLLCLLLLFHTTSSFLVTYPKSFLSKSLHSEPSSDDKETFDWDADWKRVTSGEIKPTEAGLQPPTFLEKKAIELKNTITPDKPIKITPPNTNDWRLWAGLIFLFSIGVSFLGAVNGGGGMTDYGDVSI
ncbi:hypothetical protein TrLO_g14854 [Triparma laevis f. longispina]|uniref:Transmembrane protein n=1 Tax=Triparma laevis f. longispina TaxID=1714387 RepID=A0A9W7FRN1_9STRA|nr:hypothetical protein TrLO_g14854 [Triparma laevis f. longispina]